MSWRTRDVNVLITLFTISFTLSIFTLSTALHSLLGSKRLPRFTLNRFQHHLHSFLVFQQRGHEGFAVPEFMVRGKGDVSEAVHAQPVGFFVTRHLALEGNSKVFYGFNADLRG